MSGVPRNPPDGSSTTNPRPAGHGKSPPPRRPAQSAPKRPTPDAAKTEILHAAGHQPPAAPLVPPGWHQGQVGEVEWLRQELKNKTDQAENLRKAIKELKVQLDTMRKDFSAQTADGQLELRTLQSLLERSHEQTEKLQNEMNQQKKSNKTLKSQNLRLQYHLNVWGIPVSASGEDSRVPGGSDEGRLFFPELSALVDGLDPIPVVLRGDVYTFGFPNLMHFLANSNLTGVLTVVSEGVVSKLYLEKGILRLAGWNHKSRELSLRTLLEHSDLVTTARLDRPEGDSLYDVELAIALIQQEQVPANVVQTGLREHARVILTYLYEVEQGAFFFQPGILRRQRYLQFNLPILDLLLVTAAEVDEKARTDTKTSL